MLCKHSHRLIVFFLISLIFLLIPSHWLQAAPDNTLEQEAVKQRENMVLVEYQSDYFPSQKRSMTLDKNIRQRHRISPHVELHELNTNTNTAQYIKQLKTNPHVRFAEPNHKLKLMDSPNDPYYPQQWGLHQVQASESWDLLPINSHDVLVAVIDSGIDPDHPDLTNRIAPGGFNFLLNNNDVNDFLGHGSLVAGIIAANSNNTVGIAGAAGPARVKILPLKTTDSEGYSLASDVIMAIDYAIQQQADIINLSMGSDQYSEIENAAIQRAVQAGICVVAAAGNDGVSTYCYPASYEGVLSVGSISSDQCISYFSNYNDQVDLTAPGQDIYSCYWDGSYRSANGTSFSAPMVAGIAALLIAADPNAGPARLEKILTMTATDLGSPGKDPFYGYGSVNALSAIQQIHAVSPVTTLIKDQLNRNMGTYITASATGNTIHASINSNYMGTNLQEAFAVETALNIISAIDEGYPIQAINIAGSSYTRQDIFDNFQARVSDIQSDIITLVNNNSVNSYQDIKLEDLTEKSITLIFADEEIMLQLDPQPDECFIATAAFGSKFQPSVALLRQFRDDYLLTNAPGAAFVNYYYRVSPPIAAHISNNQALKTGVRILLTPVITAVYLLYHPIFLALLAMLIGFSLIYNMYKQDVSNRPQ